MASKNKSRKQALKEYLTARQLAAITGSEWQELLEMLAPISESYLREMLRQTGLPFEQPWAGIRQRSFEELEESLTEMLEVYRQALDEGQRARARYCRRQVIGAKDRARFLLRNPATSEAKKREKEEMIAWMLVWLENPEVFPEWARIRKRAADFAFSAARESRD